MRSLIMTFGFLAVTCSAAAADPPTGNRAPTTYFARSGEQIRIAAPAARGKTPAMLRAFDRTWGKPIASQDKLFAVTLPVTRVAVTFQLVPADRPESPMARIVVYPPTPVSWNAKHPLLVDQDAPRWAREWLRAVQLPAEEVDLSAAGAELRPDAEGAGVALIGQKTAGGKLSLLLERQARWKMSAIVLDAERPLVLPLPAIQPAETVPSKTAPFQAAQGLASLQQWKPLSRLPEASPAGLWPGLANRRSWFSQNAATWVEEIATGDRPALLVSAVDWSGVLGTEPGDVLFQELLRNCAEPRRGNFPAPRSRVAIWPTERENSSRVLQAAAEKPVAREVSGGRGPEVHVIDFRGPDLPPARRNDLPLERLRAGKQIWIVLGDDAAFSDSDRALFRERSSKPAARFRWIEEDRVSANLAAEIPLMRTLTEFGVPLPFRDPSSP